LGWFQDGKRFTWTWSTLLTIVVDGTRWMTTPTLEFLSGVLQTSPKSSSSEFPIKSTPDENGFIREEGVDREHLGWRVLKEHEVVVASDTTGPGITAGL
jgi:hypothetical protein